MVAGPKLKRREQPTKRIRFAAVITRYADAFTRALTAGKLDPRFKRYHEIIMAKRERYLARLRAHEPATRQHVESHLLRLANKLYHFVWARKGTKRERKKFSAAVQGINRFIFDSPSLEAKLFALSRLRFIIRGAQPQIKSYDRKLQRRFIQHVVRLEHELRTRTF